MIHSYSWELRKRESREGLGEARLPSMVLEIHIRCLEKPLLLDL